MSVKPKAFSEPSKQTEMLEARELMNTTKDYGSSQRLLWPVYQLRPKFIIGKLSIEATDRNSKGFSPTLLDKRPVFSYPEQKILERDIQLANVEAEYNTVFTSKEIKESPKETKPHAASKSTASPSKSHEKTPAETTKETRNKPKVSKNPFKNEKKQRKQEMPASLNPSRRRKVDPLEGWESPQKEYKFPPPQPSPSQPVLRIPGAMPLSMASKATSVHEIAMNKNRATQSKFES